jgi:RNA polymerase sigma-70 factor (ECF subfamily)
MNQDLQRQIEERLLELYPRLYRLAYSYLKNEADAQDAVQNGACKALRSWKSLQNAKFADTWLFRIVMNESLTLLRARQRWSQDEAALDNQSTEDCYEDVDLKRAVEALGEPDRSIVTLRYFEELKLSEVAQVLEMPENTVKSRLYRALRKLRSALKEED